MAKQTFTTGQVLTAAQMTSLQQTAMLGGAASAKVASYTLVAADAGTAITMSNASATTITVNTALFAAGDVVNITNLGAGVCTITAGTATVNTSASLALAQYESGTLEFISTSSAVFVKGAGAAPAVGATSYALLNAGGTALTGATTITVSGLSGYNKLAAVIQGASTNAASNSIFLRLNAATTNYNDRFGLAQSTATYDPGFISGSSNTDRIDLANMSSSAASTVQGVVTIDGANSSGIKIFTHAAGAFGSGNGQTLAAGGGTYTDTNVISSISIISSGGNFDAGTIFIYGAN